MSRPDRREHGHRRRRFFRSGELPLVLLALLARRPQHGYDLMAELDRLFGPEYQPSPGSIYPALSALESEALVEATADGDRKTYALTAVGRDALQARAATAILAGNPARVFGFDLDELSNYAEAVGPSIEELASYEPTGKLWRW